MDTTIVLKNYRVIKDAKIKLGPGITLISAPNGSGKSTVLKAIKTLLDGQFGDENNKRHGQDSYAIAIKMDDHKIVARRSGTQTYLKYNDEPEVSKLGRGSLNHLEPRFPFHRVEYDDSVFYPNCSFQNKVPIFDDISVFDLFSSMFSSVSRVSERLDSLKKSALSLSKERTTLESNLNYTKSQALSRETELTEFLTQHADLDAALAEVEEQVQSWNEYTEILKDIETYEKSLSFGETSKKYQLYEQAKPIFPVLDRVLAQQPVLSQLSSIESELSSIESYPDVKFELLQRGKALESLGADISELDIQLGKLSKIDTYLLVQSYQDVSSDLLFTSSELESVEKSYQEAFEEVKAQGCPYKHLGFCS